MDEFEQRERFEKLLRPVEIEGEVREELVMQRLVGFYAGLVLGVPLPLAALMIYASRRDVRPVQLVLCMALLVFGAAASACLGAFVGPRAIRLFSEIRERRARKS